MPTLTVTEAGEGFLHEPEEWLPGTVVAIEETEAGMYGPGLKWIIALDEDDDRDTWAFCSQNLSPKSKLYGWLKAMGANLESGATVDLEDYIGHRVDVFFERYDSTRDGEAVEKEKVTKIRASKTKAPKGARTKTIDETDVEPF